MSDGLKAAQERTSDVLPVAETPSPHVVIRDVAEQKRIEEALRESERKYRELVENANSIILHWSREGRIIFLNEFGQRFFGYSEAEIRGRHVMGTLVPTTESGGRDLHPLMDEICRDPVAFEQNVNENMRRNGERVWIAWTNKVVMDPQGQVKEILSIGADITERKRAEAHVLRLNHLYAAISRLNQTIARATDRDTLFRETCRIAIEHGQFRMAWIGLIDEVVALVRPEAFAGDEQGYLSNLTIAYQDEELGRGPTGTAIREGHCVLCQDIATDPRMAAWRAAALQHGFHSSAAVPIRQANQVIGVLTAYASEPRLFDAEEEALLVEMGQSISYALDGFVREALRRQAEENLQKLNLELEQRVRQRTAELNSSNEQLRAKNSELKGFAYTVSHDLKAPLRGIAGYGNELDRKHRAGLSERAHFCLTQILTATSNLDQLIEDLLRYSRLDAETPSLTEVNLRNIVDGILHDRHLAITEHHIEVTVDIPFATLRTWERGLVQVLTNLIDNAMKYSRKANSPRLRIAAASLDGAWRLTVNDNGIGFDMKYHDRIFGLFNRLVRMEDFEGTGAGLAIAKRVVDKVGGRLWAESAIEAGATFFVDIPKPSETT
jgi:PAS domain S-box-containing protein